MSVYDFTAICLQLTC